MKIFNLIITTKHKADKFLFGCLNTLERNNKLHTWAAIRPVVYDLEKLRADTWNQDKITEMQTWLKNNFEVKNEKSN